MIRNESNEDRIFKNTHYILSLMFKRHSKDSFFGDILKYIFVHTNTMQHYFRS